MKTLVSSLRAWQARELTYRLVWGAARWVAVVAAGVTAACLADWVIDRYVDTPFAVRLLLTAGQVLVYAAAAYLCVYRLRVPTLIALADRAERLVPRFGHRLVTTLQLNRPGAQTRGMSEQLIRQVSREAESMVSRHGVGRLAPADPVWWAAALVAPVVYLFAAAVVLNPALVAALLARQCLLNVEIPHSVKLDDRTESRSALGVDPETGQKVWPVGDEVELRIGATGEVGGLTTGTVTVYPEGQPSLTLPLARAAGGTDADAVFVAKVPASTAPFTYRARVGPGRLRTPGKVRFEPRPLVGDVQAWVQLPKYVDPDGKTRYERFQPQGDATAMLDSSVRVEAAKSKPVTAATVTVLAATRPPAEAAVAGCLPAFALPLPAEKEVFRQPMSVAEGGNSVSAQFDVPPTASGYRISVADAHGFANLNPPRRGITLLPDEPPTVRLLSEVLKDPREEGPLEDFSVEWMQLRLGGQIQVGYEASSPLGLDRAYLVYRVNDGPWTPLPLTPTVADESKVGRFVPELGLFQNSGPFGQVEFYRLPAADPSEPPGLRAGGRYNFQTAALRKKKPGQPGDAPLEIGDRVEVRVAVYDRRPGPTRPPGQPPAVSDSSGDTPLLADARRPAGWSAPLFKRVVTEAEFEADRQRDYYQKVRLKELEDKQRGVFTQKEPGR